MDRRFVDRLFTGVDWRRIFDYKLKTIPIKTVIPYKYHPPTTCHPPQQTPQLWTHDRHTKHYLSSVEPNLKSPSLVKNAYIFDHSVVFREGEALAQHLTNTTVLRTGLPKDVDSKLQPFLEKQLKYLIFKSNIFDTANVQLPTRHDPSQPVWKYKSERGIPPSQSYKILIDGFLGLARAVSFLRGQSLRTIEDFKLCVDYKIFSDSAMVRVKAKFPCVLLSPSPLSFDPLVEGGAPPPDIYPLNPTIDLHKKVYEGDSGDATDVGAECWPHTIFVDCSGDQLRHDQRSANSLMYCYAMCLHFARIKYGEVPRVLPRPMNVQCVSSDGIRFHFTAFQLRGEKSVAVVDGTNMLFHKVLPKRSMLRNTKYQNLNFEVLGKFINLYLS